MAVFQEPLSRRDFVAGSAAAVGGFMGLLRGLKSERVVDEPPAAETEKVKEAGQTLTLSPGASVWVLDDDGEPVFLGHMTQYSLTVDVTRMQEMEFRTVRLPKRA